MKKTNILLISLNIIFLIYYSIQLLVYTDEFSLNNLGIFNHAIAGLSEIIGIIFLSLSISLLYILKRNIDRQLPVFITIFLIQILVLVNFLRYIYTDSPGETTIESITFNAIIFLFSSFISAIFILINFKKLK